MGLGTIVDLRCQINVLEYISPWNEQGVTTTAGGLRAAEVDSYRSVD